MVDATALECSQVAENGDWQRRVDYFMKEAATLSSSEDPVTPNYTNRQIFNKNVLDGAVVVKEMALAVTSNATIKSKLTLPAGQNVPDGDIQFAVQERWDAFAGNQPQV